MSRSRPPSAEDIAITRTMLASAVALLASVAPYVVMKTAARADALESRVRF